MFALRVMSDRERQAAELLRLNRAFRALCLCNDQLVRATSEQELLDSICRTLVEAGGYRLAWIGYPENRSRSVRPVAATGADFVDKEYLNEICVTWSDDELGRGPTGTAIRTGQPSVNRDSESNPDYGPWREKALQHRFRSSIALPLQSEGNTIGALTVYAAEPDAFDTEERSLLTRFAETLAFGIAAIRTRKQLEYDSLERGHAEDALRKSEANVRAILASLVEGVVSFDDPMGEIVSFNDAAQRLFGRPLKASRAVPPAARRRLMRGDGTLFSAEEWPWVVAHRSGEAVRDVDMGVTGPDGSVQWVSVNAQPIRDVSGRIQGTVVSLFDVTARKRSEDALRAADVRKNEFLAMLSHEIRNPLAAIRISSDILERTAPGTDQARHALAVISRQTKHISRLVDDLLDVTRITRGTVTLRREPVDLSELLRDTIEDYREEFTRKGVELQVVGADRPLHVSGDPTRLVQLFGNLLDNAAKFTSQGGHATVTLDASESGNVVIRVRDDGAGIPPEMLNHVFEPFVQAAQPLARSTGGLGLGLTLVKGLVELHGGTVRAESEGLDKGSQFIVSLPVQTLAHPSPTAVPAEKHALSARRVLVIEDNVDVADSLEIALSLADHDVSVAYTGPEGLEKARAIKPDVVLCDIGLPGLDGYGVARAIRADPELSATTLVAISGYALPEDIRKSKEAGFTCHIAKPADYGTIDKIITEARRRTSID